MKTLAELMRMRVERQRWTFLPPPAKYCSLQSALVHGISFMGSKGKFQGANMRPWTMQSSQGLLLCMWNKSYNNVTFLASPTCVQLCIWTMSSSLVVTVCHCSGTLHNIRRCSSDENQFSKDWFFFSPYFWCLCHTKCHFIGHKMKQAKHMLQFQQLRRQQRNGNESCQVYCQRAGKEMASLLPLAEGLF